MEAYDKLKQLVTSAEEDLKKAKGGNRAAGTRVRQIMQDVKSAAQDIREGILAMRAKDGQAE